MAEYKVTIGLEVHAELSTRTKMFCDSLNDPDESRPNVNVCPVCLGHPGTLPTVNREAVERVIKVGLAIGAKINPITKFDRKNYFYPDLPKGYQISQYDQPLVVGGEYAGVRVTRIHLEEDAGKLVHGDDGSTLVDFNRAGVPLMELVTEPVIQSAEEAVHFMKELQLLLRYLGVSDADLERGQMRADANVSLSATEKLGTRAEIKNLNSFRSVASAIAYEIARQTKILEDGGEVHQETRGWNDAKQKTESQRSKEHAHDYRYFPEPDLPPIRVTNGRASPADTGGPPSDAIGAFDIDDLSAHLPELPRAKQARFAGEFGLAPAQAATLVETRPLADFFEAAASELAARDESNASTLDKRTEDLLFNYLTSDLLGLMGEAGIEFPDLRVSPNELAALVDMIADGRIMSRQAKDILRKMFTTGESAEAILIAEGLHTVSDEGELAKMIAEVIAEQPKAVADYRAGKEASMQFLIGQGMKKMRGAVSPDVLKRLFAEKLS